MGIILIIIGLGIWYIWAEDYNKGQKDPMFARKIHDSPIPWIVAISLVGLGIYMLF